MYYPSFLACPCGFGACEASSTGLKSVARNLIAFNSLNRTKVYAGSGYGELIQNLSSNIEVATINGSSIVYENGGLHASGYNDYKSNGSRFETSPASGDPDYWDGDTQANR